MSSKPDKLRKPPLSGYLDRAIKFNLVKMVAISATGMVLFYVFYIRRREKAYAEYYRTLDCEEQFEQMRKQRLFTSVR